jgi:signal transduction histidine kinase
MLRVAAVLLSLLLTLGSLDAEDASQGNQQAWMRFGSFVTQVYSIPQSGFASTLTFVSQLPDGDLLVGSTNGAYLYDGSRWSQIPDVPMAFSLLETPRDEILIGSGGTIFELRKGAVGAYEAKHRLDVGGVENRVFSMAEENSGGLLGCIGRGLFYEGAHSRVRVVSPASGTQGIASIRSGVFFAINEHGFHLARLNNAQEPVDVEENFREQLGGEHVVDVEPKDPSSCWAIASDGRTFSFDGHTLHPAPWHAANPVLRIVPSCIVKLDEGYLVGSLQEGAFIFAGDGSLTTHLNLDNGLPDESVVAATTDRDGGLWIATSKNLVRLDAKLRFRDFGPKQGLKIQDSEVTTRHRGHIYVGGGGGLFVQNLSAAAQNEAFEQVPGLDIVRGLVSDGETLWIGSHRLSAIGSDGRLAGYDTKEIFSIIIPKARKDMVICGTSDGFAIFKKAEGTWHVDRLIPAGGLTVWGIGEYKPDEYWAMLGTGKAARLRQNDGIWELKIVGAESGLPERWIDLGIIDGRILAPAEMGFMTGTRASEWDEASGRFVPTEDYTYYFGWLGPHIYHPIFYRKNGEAVVMGAFRNCNLVARPPKVVFPAIQEVAHSRESCAYGVFNDEDGSIWINHVGGVLRCSGSFDEPAPKEESLVVRQIRDIRDGSLLFANVGNGRSLSLDPKHNWLRISAALLEFRSERFAIFKIWLEGFEPKPGDDSWLEGFRPSPGSQYWSTSSERDLTNLPSGKFTLHVEGLDGMGVRRQELVIPLEIRTPWFKTKSAVVCYAAAGLLLIGLLIRVREMRLRWHNRQLTRAVEEGRREIEVKHRELQGVLGKTEAIARDLARANSALEKSTQGKTEFVRTISHELRNPIAGARMMADLLCRSELDTSNRRQAANLRNCVDYLQTLLDETLDLTQVESGHIAVKLEPFTTGELIRDVASIFENIARQKDLRFEVIPGPKSDVPLLGDKTHSKRILVNYLSNAFKFTAHGSVTLRAEPILDESGLCRVRFEVQDTGPGITEAIQGRIFGAFVRESSHSENDPMPGAGLGLALSKKLAELCGGTVGFSTKVGEGSLFWVELPFIVSKKGESAQAEEADLRPDFSDLAVCVVDDDPLQLEAMATALEQFGVVPATARNAEEALGLLKAKCFGVVILDYHIGQETGLQLLLKAREQDPPLDLAKTHCHLVTALWDDSLPEKAAAAGFRGAHKKPLSLVAIFQILQTARRA